MPVNGSRRGLLTFVERAGNRAMRPTCQFHRLCYVGTAIGARTSGVRTRKPVIVLIVLTTSMDPPRVAVSVGRRFLLLVAG